LGPINVGSEAVGANLSEFLTADRNLVIVRATVQYSIKDPVAYLFHAASVDDLVAGAGTAALSSVLAGQPVDQAMTLGKQELGISVRSLLQQQVDQYRLGIAVRSVDIGSVEPPPEVAEAFDNVISALRERERMINLARGYADRTHAQAQGQVQRFRDTARATCDRSVLEADGEAERFRNLLAEYDRQPELTSRRLYLEAMAEMLPRFRAKLIVDDASDVDLSIFREELP
jgi:membrane protease subunit HflK